MAKRTKADDSRIKRYSSILELSEDATDDEIEERYQTLSAYLTSDKVSDDMREWARDRVRLVDEAYAVLSDTNRRFELDEEDVGEEVVAGAAPQSAAAAQSRLPWWRLAAAGIVIGLAVLGAVLLGRYGIPSGSGGTEDAASQANAIPTAVPLDTQRVAELMQKVQQNPNDTAALFDLGASYFLAADWQQSEAWLQKLVEIDPKNVYALTDIGTTQFNQGLRDKAQATWLSALQLAPDDPQLHYNSAIYYANSEPPDLGSARAEWQLVMNLAPGTNLAEAADAAIQALPAEVAATASPAGAP